MAFNKSKIRRKRNEQPQSSQNALFLISAPFILALLQLSSHSMAATTREVTRHKTTNKFASGGCLHQKMANWTGIRVCGSEDPPEAVTMGYCLDEDPFDYLELRLHGQNWESTIFETWILQIVLSEILHVPTSVETSNPNARVGFYDFDSRIDFGEADDWECLAKGVEIGDCRLVRQEENGTYQSCCHFIPEMWEDQFGIYEEQKRLGRIEPALPIGTIGEENWFIPKFTAERDPTLTSYIGLKGEENRRKLAERFLRPTTWREYCEEISVSQCQNDTISSRPPTSFDGDSADCFFAEGGLYDGHFRATDENDCGANPDTCAGHIFDYPCSWTSYALPQAYHLGIALKGDGTEEGGSGGYSYGQLLDALKAANATKSDIMIFWWSPEALYQQFIGTDMELTKVTLPPVTQECLDNRIPTGARCSMDLQDRVGSPLGACGEAPQPLKKVIGSRLYDLTYDNDIPKALQSPGYETLKAFQISGAETGELFDYWVQNEQDPREAVCDWVIQNFDSLGMRIPRTYPRVVQEDTNTATNMAALAAVLIACLSIFAVATAAIFVFRQRQRPAMQYAQLEFISLLLAGLSLVAVGSLLLALPVTNVRCVAAIWLTNLGYTLQLVPLIVKMAAIYRLMTAAKKLRRVVVQRKSLFSAVLLLSCAMVIFLITWTVLDPPEKETEYSLTNDLTDNEETVVAASYFCGTVTDRWRYASVGWQIVYLVIATVQAFQTRSIRQEILQSQTLAVMIYSQFMFVCLRLVPLLLEGYVGELDLMHVRSILFSLDSFATVIIYFVPKFLAKDDHFVEPASSGSVLESQTVKQLRMLAALASAQHERQISRSQRHEGISPGPRLSLPTEDFKAHLRDMNTAALTEPSDYFINNSRRGSDEEVACRDEENVQHRKICTQCGKFE